MQTATRCVLAAALLVVSGTPSNPAASVPGRHPKLPGTIVDLTHAFDADTIYWPTAGRFELESVAHGVTDKGYFYAANRFCAAEHGGTHLDAPVHFSEKGKAADAIPVEQLIGVGVRVDVSAQCAKDRDYRVSVADLTAWEIRNGRIPAGAIVLLQTGWAARWSDRTAYLGTARTGAAAVPELHFPGLHPEAARWLAESRSVKAVGLDTASIDFGQSALFESHVILFAANVPALENVAAMDELPVKDFVVAALPMKIRGGTGGPLRIVAWW
jgi:kynurenine formamidase